jgi:TatD DNase family protein
LSEPIVSKPPLFDSHCHLDFDSFGDDFADVLARARAEGVVRIATIGAGRDVSSAAAAVRLAEEHAEWIVATVGVHPHDAVHATDVTVEELAALAVSPHVVAIGEIGLDYHYDHSPRDIQRNAFRRFIAMGRELKKPIIVHTRNAAEDTLTILREERAVDVGGIIHCFSEDAAFASAALDLGFVSSFSGIVTFKNAVAIRDAALRQPADALLIETDAPFLAPVPFRGKRNEPAYIAHTARFLAELRGESFDDLCARTTANACRVFGLDLPHA